MSNVEEIRTQFPASKGEVELRSLYPPLDPYDSGFLKVSEIHDVFYEQCGNPEGNPVILFHGGPGGGIVPSYR
jgi:proline iminopeptidase